MTQQKKSRRKSAIMVNNELVQRVKSVILQLLPDAEIILYGSRARGDADTESDWDFLVLTDEPVTTQLEITLWDRLYELELETGGVFSALLKNREEWATAFSKITPFHHNVEKDGITL